MSEPTAEQIQAAADAENALLHENVDQYLKQRVVTLRAQMEARYGTNAPAADDDDDK